MPPEVGSPVVLFFPFDLLSHYSRCLQLATAIRECCDVRFACSPQYDRLVAEAGFATFRCERFDAERAMADSRRFEFSWLNAGDVERVVSSQIEVIRQHRPLAVLGDAEPTLKMAAEAAGVPFVALTNAYLTRHYAFLREVSTAHPAYRFRDKLPGAVFGWMTRLGEGAAMRAIHRPFRALRRRLGLTPRRGYLEEMEGDHTLLCDLPLLFPQRELPASFQFIGPLFHGDTAVDDEVAGFVDNGRPSLLVTMGSSGDFSRLAALNDARFAAYNVLVAGDRDGVLRGDHVLARPFLNSSGILPAIDLVVCHGGNGTLYQALAHGVPLLCSPCVFEQEWNVAAVERLGLGERLPPRPDPQQLLAAVTRWIESPAFAVFQQVRDQIDLEATRQAFAAFWRRAVMARAGETVTHG